MRMHYRQTLRPAVQPNFFSVPMCHVRIHSSHIAVVTPVVATTRPVCVPDRAYLNYEHSLFKLFLARYVVTMTRKLIKHNF